MRKRILSCKRAAIGAMGCLALIVSACGYLTAVEQAEDEILVKLVASREAVYDHPVTITAGDLATVFNSVRVEYKAGWLQHLITGPLKPLPLFSEAALARITDPRAAAFAKADRRERIVFYVSERRSDLRREVTAGSLFVQGRVLHIELSNHRNGVDVIPGVQTYDRKHPEMAVVPQRFILSFARPEFVLDEDPALVRKVFEGPPRLAVAYRLFLNFAARAAHSDTLNPRATQIH
jgi:hypothetical protein